MIMPKVSAGPMTVLADPQAVAEAVANWLIEEAAHKPTFAISLSGGSTPKRLYETLATAAFRDRFPWSKAQWFFGDERFVAADDKDSNFRMVRETMLSKVPVPEANIHAFDTAASSPDEAASRYDSMLKLFYGSDTLEPARPLFHVTLLGLGPDGHTASLIPGQPVLEERIKWVAAVAEGRPEARLTLTYPALESSGAIAFLVTGSDKAEMLAHVRSGAEDVPAGRLRTEAEAHWFVDKAAAGSAA